MSCLINPLKKTQNNVPNTLKYSEWCVKEENIIGRWLIKNPKCNCCNYKDWLFQNILCVLFSRLVVDGSVASRLVVGGFSENWSVDWDSVVGGSILIWSMSRWVGKYLSVGGWSVVGDRWPVSGRCFCKTFALCNTFLSHFLITW